MEKTKILLVDDEEDFTANLKKLLENRGYEVTALNSGDSALQSLCNGGRPDIMVMDLKMPGLDGISTLKEIRKHNLSIPTLVLTGHGDIGTALEAMKLGAYDYLTKPCEIAELEEKLEELRPKINGKKQSFLGKMLNTR